MVILIEVDSQHHQNSLMKTNLAYKCTMCKKKKITINNFVAGETIKMNGSKNTFEINIIPQYNLPLRRLPPKNKNFIICSV
jgi:hypothetical protein